MDELKAIARTQVCIIHSIKSPHTRHLGSSCPRSLPCCLFANTVLLFGWLCVASTGYFSASSKRAGHQGRRTSSGQTVVHASRTFQSLCRRSRIAWGRAGRHSDPSTSMAWGLKPAGEPSWSPRQRAFGAGSRLICCLLIQQGRPQTSHSTSQSFCRLVGVRFSCAWRAGTSTEARGCLTSRVAVHTKK